MERVLIPDEFYRMNKFVTIVADEMRVLFPYSKNIKFLRWNMFIFLYVLLDN